MKKAPKQPKEDPSVRVLRERQVRDLADLDEEENLRIKGTRKSRGVGSFRRTGSANGSTNATGQGSPAGGTPTAASRTGRLGKFSQF